MRYINRSSVNIPDSFTSSRYTNVKEELFAFHNENHKQTRFKFDGSVWMKVRKELSELFEYRCSYCESKVGATFTGLIDHFRPKASAINLDGHESSGYWWLAYEWNNLYLSCEVCNRYKRNKFPVKGKRAAFNDSLDKENYLLIDPCSLRDIEEANFFYDQNGNIYSNSERGQVTIEVLALNRAELCERRLSIIKSLQREFQIASLSGFSFTETKYISSEIRNKFKAEEYPSLIKYFIDSWASSLDEEFLLSDVNNPEFEEKEQFKSISKAIEKPELLDIEGFNDDFYRKTKLIKKIRIKNFKSISDLDVRFPSAMEEQESWMMIIGENGVGKSTILQAISLALCGQKYLDELDIKWSSLIKRPSGARRAEVEIF